MPFSLHSRYVCKELFKEKYLKIESYFQNEIACTYIHIHPHTLGSTMKTREHEGSHLCQLGLLVVFVFLVTISGTFCVKKGNIGLC